MSDHVPAKIEALITRRRQLYQRMRGYEEKDHRRTELAIALADTSDQIERWIETGELPKEDEA